MTATLRPYSLSLSSPLDTAAGTIHRREGFLLERTLNGVGGIGEAAPLPGWTESFRECEVALRRARSHLGADDEAAARDVVAGSPAAAHAIDCVDLDRRARRADRPLYRYLGANGRVESVPVNAVIGDGSPDTTVTAARRAVARGFDCLKIKVGARDPYTDLNRLRSVRDALDKDTNLRIDVNTSWTAETAQELWPELTSLGIRVVEQPLGSEELDAHRTLRNLDGPAIALDESVRDLGPGTVLGSEAADIIIIKPMVLGGVEHAATVAGRAESAGIDPVITTTVDAAVARAAAVHVAATIPNPRPCGLATADRLETDVAPDATPITDGRIAVPQASGHGVRLAEEEQK